MGKNDRYGHPKDEVLKNSKIYRTDLAGSIEIKLNKDETFQVYWFIVKQNQINN